MHARSETIPVAPPPRRAETAWRLTQLDALRGLAALSVFWGHAFGMMAQRPEFLAAIQPTPLRFFYDGRGAVRLFFVLSGFVLNLKYCSGQPYEPGWARGFVVRRIFRIYPAFFAGLLLAFILRLWIFEPGSLRPFSPWFAGFWQHPVPWNQVPRLLTLVAPSIYPDFINPPLWSLVYEMRISLFFPLIILVVNAPRRWGWDAALLVACFGICCPLAQAGTFLFVPLFFLGAMGAKYFKSLRPRLSSLGWGSKGLWLVASLVLYQLGAMSEAVPSLPASAQFAVEQLVGFGAVGLILACGSFARLSALLERPLFQFIGRTSYSFYLVHMLILIGAAPFVFALTRSYLVTWAFALVVAYLISAAIFRFVEVPGMQLGARMARSVAKPPGGVKSRSAQVKSSNS